MKFVGLAYLIPLALLGCSKAESKNEAPNETPKAVEAPNAVAPPSTPPATPDPLPPAMQLTAYSWTWNVGGQAFETTVERDATAKILVRLVSGTTTIDVPVTGGGYNDLRREKDRLIFTSRSNDAGETETADSFYAAAIAWDATQNKPVINDTWTCSDEVRRCTFPKWVGPITRAKDEPLDD